MNQVWTALVGLGLGSVIFGPAVVAWWRNGSRGTSGTVWLDWSSPSGAVKSVAVGTIVRSPRRGWMVTVEHGARWFSSVPHEHFPITVIEGAVTAYGWTQRAAVRRATARCRDDRLWRRG